MLLADSVCASVFFLAVTLCLLPAGRADAEMLRDTWKKEYWQNKTASNPIESIAACHKFFPKEHDDVPKSCQPGDLFLTFEDKTSNTKIAEYHYSDCRQSNFIMNWISGGEAHLYYEFTDREKKQKNITRNLFCQLVVGVSPPSGSR